MATVAEVFVDIDHLIVYHNIGKIGRYFWT
jgi:hypothetical protein